MVGRIELELDINTLPKTRKEALENGLRYYYNEDKKCRNGHTSIMCTDGGCIICKRRDRRNYYKRHEEKIKEIDKRRSKKYHATHKEQEREYRRLYNIKNAEILKKRRKEYCKNNKAKLNARCADRHARKLKARPAWLTKEHKILINNFYILSKALTAAKGIKHHVDHIYPLKGKNSCGLHVPWNLQVLTAEENVRKWCKEPY